MRFSLELSRVPDRRTIQFDRIHEADLPRITELTEVRTIYRAGPQLIQIVWARQYGRWRVSNANAARLASLPVLHVR